ncbi:efflux RND transporter periplasmic adaptor subunit [Tautonia sociabilis]|uniref:Efflux RND transporter periplasmic adaptor subunit n=1 Tax=Tautonia sociabilis TaxID=2080755 RepID=A0A432MD13_9BACT|nr:efflux RND transporter periplasmic adaptor subunit [Tautonia sociabilis]RUL82544.1 efflux RND transporter periplasmic adaptor subunit [Tautonia sociabilis]
MRFRERRDWAGLVALGLMATLIAGCGPVSESTRAARDDSAAGTPSPTSIATVRPEPTGIRRITSQPGQIEAFETTAIHAKIAGYVRSLAVDIGDRITEGQVIAELSVPEVEAELQMKRAMIEQAEAERTQAEAAVEVAQAAVTSAEAHIAEVQAAIRRTEADVARWQAEYNRIDQLVRERAITDSLRDETRSKLAAAQAARDEAGAQVRSAEAALAQAQAELDKARSDVAAAAARVAVAEADARQAEAMAGYTKIVAPYDGVVTRRHVDTGHLTVPGGSGDPLFVVARTDKVRIAVGVPETDAPLVNPGDRAEVRLQALDGRTFEGQVTRISWVLDQTTRTLRAEVDLENPEGVLRPGLYAYATIVAEERPDALTVPATAIVRDGGKAYCVVVADGEAHRREVELGLGDGQRVEILSGLDGDEAIAAANADSLAEGQPVEAEQPELAGATAKS